MLQRTRSIVVAVAIGAGALALAPTATAAAGAPSSAPATVGAETRTAAATKIVDFDATPDDVLKGKSLEVSGQLLREDGGWKGLADQEVAITFRAKGTDAFKQIVKVKTGKDGLFKATVTAEVTGWWRADFAGTATAKPSTSDTDRVDVKEPPKFVYSRITDFRVWPGSVDEGDTIHVRGHLQVETDKGWAAYKDQRVHILFRADGSSRWEHVTSDWTGHDGRFAADLEARASGHWRAVFEGAKGVKGAGSHAVHVTVREPEPEREASRVVKFNASPEPVRYGKYLKFTGKLQVRDDWGWDGHHAKVGLYFKPKYSDKWYFVKNTWSTGSGKLYTKAKAYRSGYWKFVFRGDEDFYGDSSRSDYVRVKR
ncbi:hypothetical protein [Planobispora longispora]|uniref:Htaa domain protein n=1 Tax=Planobispora longispora TaxID=28887 RepID=A0A8J3RQV0_9ACTN|nr:hypothetical protein [Planobispora longispora]GIH79514.1 hypothetical protein Plo01_59430 [Planobispora longispora]